MNQQNNIFPKAVGAVVISAILLIGVYTLILNNKPADSASGTNGTSITTSETTISNNTPSSTDDQQTVSTQNNSGFKDGTYTKSISYRVPEGHTNTISAEITLKDGIITGLDTNNNASDRESEFYISNFESSIKSSVVGKKINAKLSSRIGGASLTTSAFTDILDSISSQAKS